MHVRTPILTYTIRPPASANCPRFDRSCLVGSEKAQSAELNSRLGEIRAQRNLAWVVCDLGRDRCRTRSNAFDCAKYRRTADETNWQGCCYSDTSSCFLETSGPIGLIRLACVMRDGSTAATMARRSTGRDLGVLPDAQSCPSDCGSAKKARPGRCICEGMHQPGLMFGIAASRVTFRRICGDGG